MRCMLHSAFKLSNMHREEEREKVREGDSEWERRIAREREYRPSIYYILNRNAVSRKICI